MLVLVNSDVTRHKLRRSWDTSHEICGSCESCGSLRMKFVGSVKFVGHFAVNSWVTSLFCHTHTVLLSVPFDLLGVSGTLSTFSVLTHLPHLSHATFHLSSRFLMSFLSRIRHTVQGFDACLGFMPLLDGCFKLYRYFGCLMCFSILCPCEEIIYRICCKQKLQRW